MHLSVSILAAAKNLLPLGWLKPATSPEMQKQLLTDDYARKSLEVLWLLHAEKLLAKVIEVTGLDPVRADALRHVALRPMDFKVKVRASDSSQP
jgi:hypothetical protein